MSTSEQLAAIVRAAQAGDERAFGELVARFQDIAVAYATSILRDSHLAEDAAQEAFFDAYRALPGLRESAAFPGWFRRIVFKQCDRVMRRKTEDVAALDAAASVQSLEPSPHETLEADYERSGSVRRWTVAEYDALAVDLAGAFAGDEHALRRIIQHFRLERPLTWDHPPHAEQVSRLRSSIRERLANADRPSINADELDMDNARLLIARSEGFADWPALVAASDSDR